jgi:hypothetical protein
MMIAFVAKSVESICGNCEHWYKNFGRQSLYGTCEVDGDIQQYAHNCSCDIDAWG